MTAEREHSAVQRVFSGSTWVLVSQAITFGLVFLAQRMILSSLTKEENGTLFFVRRLTDLAIVVFVDLGLNGVVTRRAVQEPERAPEIISSVIAFRLGMWTLTTVLCVAIAVALGYAAVDVLIWSIYILIAARTTLVRHTIEVRYRSTSRWGIVSMLGILDVVLFTVGVWMMRDVLTPSLVIIIFAVTAVPGFVLLLLLDRGATVHPRHVRGTEIRSVVREAMPVIASLGLIMLHQNLDSLILEIYGTSRDMGTLGAVYTAVGQIAAFIPVGVSVAAMPEIARFTREQSAERGLIIVDIMRVMVVIGTLLAATMSPLMPWFVDLVSGGRYADDVRQFTWMIWTAPPVALLVFGQELTVAMGRQRLLLVIAGALVVLTAVFGLALIPSMLSEGAVLARLFTVTASAGVAIAVVRTIVGQALDLLFVLRCILFVGASMALTLIVASDLQPAVALAVSVVGTVGAAILTGLVRRNDLRRLASLRR